MYGQPPHFRRPGGGRGQQPPPQQFIPPNYPYNTNYYLQPPTFPLPFPNFNPQNPSFNPNSQISKAYNQRPIHNNSAIENIDRAVGKCRRELIDAGENVSAVKVAQAALLLLEADSWDSLGFQMQNVPSLYRLMLIEGKINAFINCFVGVWKITTLYDLETAICKNEGVQKFEELELGPLIRHPLISHYFCVSSDSTKVFKITGHEILRFLVEFMDIHKGKEVKADELLDFIAEKRSVDSKEKLHVRIQSLGLHISLIRQAKPKENAILTKYLSSSSKPKTKRPLFTEQKKQLDENFSVLSERIKSFSSEHGKHIHFLSSSSEDEEDDIESDGNEDEACLTSQSKSSSKSLKSSDRVSSCPYPSATEEKTRLGISTENEESPSLDPLSYKKDVNKSSKKRKSDAIVCTSSSHNKLPKRDNIEKSSLGKEHKSKYNHENIADMSINNESMMTFITLWKEACKTKNASEVISQMFTHYKAPGGSKLKNKVVKRIYESFPLIGLTNVAVQSIKQGMWDSMYDTFQAFEQQEEPNTNAEDNTKNISIEIKQTDTRLVSKHVSNKQCEVSLEDILKKVSIFLNDNHDVTVDISSSLGKNAIFLRNLYKCEVWLTQQFGVEKFESFGHGDFLKFVEKNVSALPSSFQKYFVNDRTHDKPPLNASMSHQLLDVLVAQASNSLVENENLSVQNVEDLLSRQFPMIHFELDKEGSSKALDDVVKANKNNTVSKSLLFSSALLAPRIANSSLETHLFSKEAIEVLLRAPMLTDLNTWSHWDILFAPSLGPLTTWLLNETNVKDLHCIITKSGNVIRIDHTATMDSFLEASIKGSSFQTAVNLLSLFDLYGGEKTLPISLLKCHSEKAFKVILNNDLSKNKSSASKFILDCLAFIPVEFRCFATDLLLSGFRSIVKDAHSAILSECRNTENRLMLHELGLSLGIIEWIDDYKTFSVTEHIKSTESDQEKAISIGYSLAEDKGIFVHNKELKVVDVVGARVKTKHNLHTSKYVEESTKIIESIRQEEFGLDPKISAKEDHILKKQHARLGRALHCLSQELYSQDSHFLLELVQNADDNIYPCDVEPTLTFILQEAGIVVLNNEQGFSVENIKALCDVGNSTKKEPSAGYIGKKGIGFKSVFRVTDAPEIHSNGFHIKFDISDGQIGFVLPTVVPPCDIDLYSKLVTVETDPKGENNWNTCIILPFKSEKNESFSVDNLLSMFSDLHPSLLLFLHRLECIRFKNLLTDSLIVMRKEIVGNGIVNVSLENEKMTWFVESRTLQADHIRQDVKSTEISMALMLKDSDNGNYIAKLDHQPVFAFLPLRNYGLKFIIQADFILPSSREEVDGDSPWNQWLLSEFPSLFVSAERSLCSLPFFKENPAKGVSLFLSFVPLGGEVHGFFSCLPRMILSKLRTTKCLLLEGDMNEWVLPCKVLRNWTEETRSLLPDSLIKEHLGVGYLHKDIILTDFLARALGIEDCGPKILVQILTSLCQADSLKSMGLNWLSSFLNVLYMMLVNGTQSDVVSPLCQLRFIPLLDGNYASVSEGPIWLHADPEHGLEAFRNLYPKLRIVSRALFNDSHAENITQMLYKVGGQRLSAHEVLKVHILPAISDEKLMGENSEMMIEYLSYIMFHLESSCSECRVDKELLLSRLRNNAFISTNHGCKRLVDTPIHFSNEFGNPVDMNRLVGSTDMQWFEVDIGYLKHPVYDSSSKGTLKWRKFLQELGVTDFVQIIKVEKRIEDISLSDFKNMMLDDDCISSGSIVQDWDSKELKDLLSNVSLAGDREKGKYLLEVLDTLWDDYFSDKVTGFCNVKGQLKPFKSSVIRILHGVRWLASSMDDQLHLPKDLFHNCETVRAVFGDSAPYAIPKVNNVKLLNGIGLKNTISIDDALLVLEAWRRSEKPLMASISQMSKFYTYIWNEMNISKQKIMENLQSQAFIFVPYTFGSMHEVVSGSLLSSNEVYWHDSTGSMEQIKSTHHQFSQHTTHRPFNKMLSAIYPGLRYFFVNEFGVAENPPLLSYLQSLLQLSSGSLPSEAAKTVFQVFQKWTDGLESGIMSSDDVDYLKKILEEKETRILPTVQDKWVSLHQSFGLICWCDDDQLRKEFKNLNNVDFLYFGELTTEEQQNIQDKVSILFRRLGISALSEAVTREAIYYGPMDSSFKTSLVSWALPFAQRYIYSLHPQEYTELKRSSFKNLNSLRIVVVEKLFYKNVIKKFRIESDKRHDCNILLQDNILYATRDSDTHSLFMELSNFLVAGIPGLHLSNFLHMITTMAESGSTEEQMEFFIAHSQKLLKIPNEESPWSLMSTSSLKYDKDISNASSCLSLDDLNPSKSSVKKFGNNSCWPPVNWKTAPGFEFALRTNKFSMSQTRNDVSEGLIKNDTEWIIEENPTPALPSVISELDEVSIHRSNSGTDMTTGFKTQPSFQNNAVSSEMNAASSNLIEKDQLNIGMVTPQQVITGMTGELVAFKHFSAKFGEECVKWVNEIKESGLPYDIVVKGNDNSKQYIEVKTTSSVVKDWFEITVREWQFAAEKGDSFSIARVVLSDGKSAQITTYKNPVKLCQSRHLQLAILS